MSAEEWDPPDIGLDLVDHVHLIAALVEKATGRFDSELLWQEIGRAGALHIYEEAKALSGLVRGLQNEAERLLIAAMEGERKAEVDGRVVEVRRSWNRKWDHPMVIGAIAASTLQGERLPEVDTVVTAVAGALGAATQWKTGALKDMGIDDEGYCSKELGRATVSVQ